MKKNTLHYLLKANGNYISGEEIAAKCSTSRMSVSKDVAALRAEGAVIESTTKCGYRLLTPPTTLYSETVKAFLPFDEEIDVYCHKTIGSTNEEAKKLAAEGAGHGTTVIAEEQTRGRGRYGRTFFSPYKSGIYMSVILRPSARRTEVLYTVCAAVAVRRVLSRYNENSKIKWVNDIYVNDRKICGILCEAVSELELGRLEAVICGIGVNLGKPEGEFPADISQKAGALTDSEVNRAKIAAEIIEELLCVIEQDTEDVVAEYEKNMMLIGRSVSYSQNGILTRATVTGVDRTGGLVVASESGESCVLRSGEVHLESF